MLEEIDWLRVSFYISLYLIAALYVVIFLTIIGHILMPKKLLQKSKTHRQKILPVARLNII